MWFGSCSTQHWSRLFACRVAASQALCTALTMLHHGTTIYPCAHMCQRGQSANAGLPQLLSSYAGLSEPAVSQGYMHVSASAPCTGAGYLQQDRADRPCPVGVSTTVTQPAAAAARTHTLLCLGKAAILKKGELAQGRWREQKIPRHHWQQHSQVPCCALWNGLNSAGAELAGDRPPGKRGVNLQVYCRWPSLWPPWRVLQT